MATYYSAFFSSGLLAPAGHMSTDPSARPITPDGSPVSPTTPRAALTTLLNDQDPDTTPTTHDFISLPTGPSSSNTLPSITESPTSPQEKERPRLRRRRSSMTMNASPLASIKGSGSIGNASAAVRGHTLMAPATIRVSRSRSGSMTDTPFNGRVGTGNDATQGNSLMGRLRSGSMSAIRSRRPSRKQPPPPTMPLPALPPLPSATAPPTLSFPLPPSSASPTEQTPTTPRRPLARRAHTDNLIIPIYTPPTSRIFTPSSAMGGMTLEDSPMIRPGLNTNEGGLAAGTRPGLKAGGMDVDVDYPSPVDTPNEKAMAGYFGGHAKEN